MSLVKKAFVEVKCNACGAGVQKEVLFNNGFVNDTDLAKHVLGADAHLWVKAHKEYLHKKCLVSLGEPPEPEDPDDDSHNQANLDPDD